MDERVLVTGAGGFVGRQLCEGLSESGHEVYATDISLRDEGRRAFPCDVSDPAQVERLFEWAGPVTKIFHLAAITFVPEAMNAATDVMRVNLLGTMHVLDAALRYVPEARILYVGSSECYGQPEFLPVTEAHPLAPVNPYAISKAAADAYCRCLHALRGARIVRVRPFNHTGPGQSARFAVASFAQQIARIESGAAPPVLNVGDLSARRDFTDVRDVVSAYRLLLDRGQAGECYNVCSAHSHSLESVLNALLGSATVEIDIRVDPARLRAVDVPEIKGSYEKLHADTGWSPQIPFDETLADLLEYFRSEAVSQTR